MGKYFGFFEKIRHQYPHDIEEIPFYYKDTVAIYDKIATSYYDTHMFMKQVILLGGPVLELCCGTGRVTLPLLKSDVEITALDMSEDMLFELNRIISNNKAYRKYKDNIKTVVGNMLTYQSDKKFNLIIIAATSIRLIDGNLERFFDSMYELLNDGGVLFFNFEDIPRRKDIDEILEPIMVSDYSGEVDELDVICMQRYIDYKKEKAYVNLLELNPHSKKRQVLSCTEYSIFGRDDIEKAFKASKFSKCDFINGDKDAFIYCKLVKE